VEQELALQIMTSKSENCHNEEIIKELDNICEECKKEDESVSQNLILTSYKLCLSCRVSKTIFPI
jgi:hypothetical protein